MQIVTKLTGWGNTFPFHSTFWKNKSIVFPMSHDIFILATSVTSCFPFGYANEELIKTHINHQTKFTVFGALLSSWAIWRLLSFAGASLWHQRLRWQTGGGVKMAESTSWPHPPAWRCSEVAECLASVSPPLSCRDTCAQTDLQPPLSFISEWTETSACDTFPRPPQCWIPWRHLSTPPESEM